jgi:non-specific serine/threonine protein kinase/serine/threonine-protein kinase
MTSEKLSADEIFAEALLRPQGAERAKYLDEVYGDNPAARQRIDRLLRAHAEAQSFLESPAEDPLATEARRPSIAELPGAEIGPYKLLEQIGEGGFGIVFMAEQTRPVRRQVALKIIKPGMDTKEVVARFEAERQALALMDHPNIAKVYDAGTTGEPGGVSPGRPYFVMELVHGVPITEFCDSQKLPHAQRLALFIDVCRAVQHAHQKGVIHRDLKPSNVLVTLHDDRAVPKVIDFGVAKAVGQELTEKTLFTHYGQMIGTPTYMSPEQAQLSGLDVDTRSDVYSLGVLLYELVTGTTAFDEASLKQAGFDEMRRIIREDDPPRPSERVSTLKNDLLSTVADRRQIDPRKLGQSLRGEMDWIVMKCLEKDRNRRYESAGNLARDIERYLHDEPVQACPPSASYRFKKFIRRNKVAAAFIALLLISVAGLTISNIATKRERDAKATALADANAVSFLLQEMLASSFPDQVKDSQYTVRELLDEFSAKLDEHLRGQSDVEAAIRSVIGRSYWRLGAFDQADLNLKRALDLRRQSLGQNDERVADALCAYAWNLAEQGRIAEGESCIREALSIYRKHDAKLQMINAEADALYYLVLAQLRRNDRAAFRATCKELINLPVRSEYVVLNSRPVWPLCLASDALDDMSELVMRAERFVADNSLHQGHYGPYVLGAALFRAGRYPEAVKQLELSIAAYPTDLPHGFDTLNYQRLLLAMTQWKLGQKHEARQLLRETRPSVDKEIEAPTTRWNRRTSLELLRDEATSLIASADAIAIESSSQSADKP